MGKIPARTGATDSRGRDPGMGSPPAITAPAEAETPGNTPALCGMTICPMPGTAGWATNERRSGSECFLTRTAQRQGRAPLRRPEIAADKATWQRRRSSNPSTSAPGKRRRSRCSRGVLSDGPVITSSSSDDASCPLRTRCQRHSWHADDLDRRL